MAVRQMAWLSVLGGSRWVWFAGGHRNMATRHAIARAGMKVLPAWNMSLLLPQFHKHIHPPEGGGQCAEVMCDCTHVCTPSWGQLALAGEPETSRPRRPVVLRPVALLSA